MPIDSSKTTVFSISIKRRLNKAYFDSLAIILLSLELVFWTTSPTRIEKMKTWFGGAGMGFVGVILCLGFWFQYHRSESSSPSNRRWFQPIIASTIASVTALSITISVAWRGIEPIISGKGSRAYLNMDRAPIKVIDLGITTFDVQKLYPIDTWENWLDVWHDTEISVILLGCWCLTLLYKPLWKSHWIWCVGTVIALGLPFGSGLQISESIWIPTPFVLLQKIFPPMIRCQYVGRLQFAYTIPAMMLTGFAIRHWLTTKDPSRRIQVGLGVFLIAINLVNWPRTGVMLTDRYEVLDETAAFFDTKKGKLLEIPYNTTNSSYVQQIWHKRPTNGGPGIDTVRENRHTRYFNRNKITATLESIAGGTSFDTTLERRSLLQLQRDNFRWVLVHLNQQSGRIEEYEYFLQTTATILDDRNIAVLPLPQIQLPSQ